MMKGGSPRNSRKRENERRRDEREKTKTAIVLFDELRDVICTVQCIS